MKFDHIVVKKRDTFVEDSVYIFMVGSKEKCTYQQIVPWQSMVVPIERLNIENGNNVVLANNQNEKKTSFKSLLIKKTLC